MLKELMRRFQKPQMAQLPGYTALGVIRDGGTSIVFKAKEQQTGRIVAVKVYKPGGRKAGAHRDAAHRDVTEGQIVASLNHPNTVKCLGHGLLADTPYLVLEYLEGTTLALLLAGGRKRLAGHRLTIVRQGAAALAHVHGRRFVHRDFCPRNLFITAGGVKLIDFSLATPFEAVPIAVSRAGTTETLAPEVLKREPSDHRVDVFAWGVVAYEVLSGKWPFEQQEQHQVLTKILNVRPVPLERRVPDLPAQVSEVVMKCLEKDPAKRLGGMNAVLAVLDQYRNLAF